MPINAELPLSDAPDNAKQPAAPKRAKPGQRRDEILQALATMLQTPGSERITTAALAKQLGLSEAALYRHFRSKALMFDALVDFIEQAVRALVQQVTGGDVVALSQASPEQARRTAMRVVAVILQFAQRNPGLVRVMTGEVLLELPVVHARVNQVFHQLEADLRQCLRPATHLDAQVGASVLLAFLQGRLTHFVRTGFRREPTEHLEASLALLMPI